MFIELYALASATPAIQHVQFWRGEAKPLALFTLRFTATYATDTVASHNHSATWSQKTHFSKSACETTAAQVIEFMLADKRNNIRSMSYACEPVDVTTPGQKRLMNRPTT
jgi:hypothetical protein